MRFVNWTVAILSFAIAGCGAGDGRLSVYPVSGKVVVKGQPASGAKVIFYPSAPDAIEKKLPVASGETDSAGTFKLQSYEPEDGAPEGDYKIAIVWPEPPRPNATGIFDERDRLGGRYSNPDKSGLTAHVESGGGEIPPFQLK